MTAGLPEVNFQWGVIYVATASARFIPVLTKASTGLRVNPELSFVKDARYDPCRAHSKLGVPIRGGRHDPRRRRRGLVRSRVQLLSYLAVRPGLRGQGISSMLLTAAVRDWTAEPEPFSSWPRLRTPRYHHDTESGDASAQVRLYERTLQLPYTVPAVKRNGRRVPRT